MDAARTEDIEGVQDHYARRLICAGCGAIIRPDWIIDDVLCPYCLDKLRTGEPSWSFKEVKASRI